MYSTVPRRTGVSASGVVASVGRSIACIGLSAIVSSTENFEPTPSVLSAPRAPPMSSTRPLDNARPSPVPSTSPSCTSSRSNGVKRRCIRSVAMPAPVSATVRWHRPGGMASHETVTAPSGRLYLSAFERRFSSTCWSRCRSAMTCPSKAMAADSLMPRAAARGLTRSSAPSMTSRVGTGSSEIENFPASIRAMSRTSLISARRCRPPLRMCSTPSRCSGLWASSSRSWAKPRMPLSGVRSS